MRILIAEDEKDLNEILVKRLKNENYGVDSCLNGEDAWDFISLTDYDAVVLDIMMPKLNGIEVLKRMRSKNIKTPVLLLTAKDSIEDRVNGLNCGADDYLIKPFAFDELLARIKVMIRRKTESVSNIFTLADLTVDCDSHKVKRGDVSINLSSKEFAILEYMIRNQGIVLSKEKIEQHIWNYDYEGGNNVIKVYIRYLRKKIDDDFDVSLIQTVRNLGYVLRVE
ncbi:response regulator transcription factor [Anaerotignum sp.]|uniref:response regulator transcription factor n=1 Tax=Anaerotignum sp. TaxID=2039241 RepID=UPI0027151224|nr:response regulator transcription factor [Anaerotignum sp.]